MSLESDREALTQIIITVTDRWDEPLDDVHDVPQIVEAILWSEWLATRYSGLVLSAAEQAKHDNDARIRAETLREVANGWTRGEWANVLLPKPEPPAVPVVAYANRVGDWLRERALRAEEGEGT